MSNDEAAVKCTYCGKELTADTIRHARITQQKFVHGTTRVVTEEYPFCLDGPCAGYYQMGCDG